MTILKFFWTNIFPVFHYQYQLCRLSKKQNYLTFCWSLKHVQIIRKIKLVPLKKLSNLTSSQTFCTYIYQLQIIFQTFSKQRKVQKITVWTPAISFHKNNNAMTCELKPHLLLHICHSIPKNKVRMLPREHGNAPREWGVAKGDI